MFVLCCFVETRSWARFLLCVQCCSLSVLELNTWVLCVCVWGGGCVRMLLCVQPFHCMSCVLHHGQRMGMLPHTGDEVIIVLSVFSSLYNCCSKVFIVNNTSYGATNYSRRPVNAQRLSSSTLFSIVCAEIMHMHLCSWWWFVYLTLASGVTCYHILIMWSHVMVMWWSCEHTHSVCWRLHRYQPPCMPVLWRYQPQD